MKQFLLLLAVLMFVRCLAAGQTGDLGAQIAAEDAALGNNAGEIHVAASGIISEGKVSLSVGHDLVCNDQITISLNAGSYLYLNSHTRISNCIISATPTLIQGEIQSINTSHVQLDHVTLVGGGNLVYWDRVNDFSISDNTIVSITAVDPATNVAQSGYYLLNCSHGNVVNLKASNFVFPVGPGSIPAIVGLFTSHDITINNIYINNVDASFDFGGSGIQINGSSHVTVNGGVITNNAKMDGITSESWGNLPSSDEVITGLNASYNGGPGLNSAAPLSLGDGIDIINTRHVRIYNCTLLGSGSLGNEQPAIWLFLDDDVVVENSDMSDGSMGGLDMAGSPNVTLINNSINRNQASGTFAEAQIGTATSVGTTLTFVGGPTGSFGLAWRDGTPLMFDGVTYQIASVPDNQHAVLTTAPPDHSSPASWTVDSLNEQIVGGVINDNGLAGFGGATQVGISWADGTTGIISGVTSINTGVGAQLYGLRFDNTANALLSGNTFSPNLDGGDGIFGSSQALSSVGLSFPNQGVATISAAQTVTLSAGAVAVQNLAIQVGGDFSETDNCGAALSAFAFCQIELTFAPTAAGSRSGTLSVTDSAPDSPQTISLVGVGVSQGLGLSIATGSSNSVAVAAGMIAKYSLSIGGDWIAGTASLSCTGAPPGTVCNVPATEAINATLVSAFTVSVTTLAPTTGALRPTIHPADHPTNAQPAPWLWAFTLGWVVLPAGISSLRSGRRYLRGLPLLLLMFLCACGDSPRSGIGSLGSGTGGSSGGSGSPGTPTGSYTLTITATCGSTTEQIPLILTVQ
jgi:hypothetical protein